MVDFSCLLALVLAAATLANAAGTATFRLADKTDYALLAKYTAPPTGSGIDIIGVANTAAGAKPLNGVDLRIGPDLKKQLSSVIGKSCGTDDHNNCYNQIRSVVVNQETNLQVRQILPAGYVLGAVLVAFVSILTQWFKELNAAKNAIVPDVHVPYVQLEQAASIYSSSISVVALASGTSQPFATITPQASLTFKPQSALITPVSVTTLAADASPNKKGDVIFKITAAQAARWQELLIRTNGTHCQSAQDMARSHNARSIYDPLWSNVLCGTEVLLGNMYNDGGAAAGLMLNFVDIVRLVNRDADQALRVAQGYARQVAPLLRVDALQAERYTTAAFTIAWQVLLQRIALYTEDRAPRLIVLPAMEIATSQPPVSSCEKGSTRIGVAHCRFQGHIEACTTMYTTTMTCGAKTSGRPMVVTSNIVPWTVRDETPATATSSLPVPKPTDNTRQVDLGDLKCGTRTDPGNPKRFVDRDMMLKAANFFCDKQIQKKTLWAPGKVPEKERFVEMHYNDRTGDPVLVSMRFGTDLGCPATDFSRGDAKSMCMNRLLNIVDGCDTNNSANRHWWKQGGTFYRDCITWSIGRDSVWKDFAFAASLTDNDRNDAWRPKTHTCSSDSDCREFDRYLCAQVNPVGCIKQSELTDLGWCGCVDK